MVRLSQEEGGFYDVSSLNEGGQKFSCSLSAAIHKGLGIALGNLIFTPETRDDPMTAVIVFSLFADHMQARNATIPLLMKEDVTVGPIEVSFDD